MSMLSCFVLFKGISVQLLAFITGVCKYLNPSGFVIVSLKNNRRNWLNMSHKDV